MRKNFKLLFMSLAIGVLALVGCGNGEKGSSKDGTVTLELFSNKSESINTYKAMIQEFEEENPDDQD